MESKLRKMVNKFKTMSKLKMVAYIKGEMKKKIKRRKKVKRYKSQRHHTQESIMQFKETTLSTWFLVISKKG
jgi:ribosomal protein S13